MGVILDAGREGADPKSLRGRIVEKLRDGLQAQKQKVRRVDRLNFYTESSTPASISRNRSIFASSDGMMGSRRRRRSVKYFEESQAGQNGI